MRVYTTINTSYDLNHIIQTAESESGIELSLSDLRGLLWRGGALMMVLALLGGWLLTWGVLATARRMSRTAQAISAPITTIRCNLDLLAKAPDLAPTEVAEALNETRAEADRMGRLVNDLLVLARADNVKQEVLADGYKKPAAHADRVDCDRRSWSCSITR